MQDNYIPNYGLDGASR